MNCRRTVHPANRRAEERQFDRFLTDSDRVKSQKKAAGRDCFLQGESGGQLKYQGLGESRRQAKNDGIKGQVKYRFLVLGPPRARIVGRVVEKVVSAAVTISGRIGIG